MRARVCVCVCVDMWICGICGICESARPRLIGVPVAVVDDHGIRRREVDSEATRASGEQKHVVRGIRVEHIHLLLSLLPLCSGAG